jgi:capsular exopolysaccharide synthesis family protein
MSRVANAFKKVHQWHGPQSADGIIEDTGGATALSAGAGTNGSVAEAQHTIIGNRTSAWPQPDSYGRSEPISADPLFARASDEFQVLCATLQSLANEEDRHMFAITSALAGEGKSFVALNLAASLARNGARVLLIDANLNKPSMHRALGMDRLLGMSDCLSGKASFEASVRATGLAGLAFVSSGGAVNSSPPELFANPRMREFVTAAKAAYSRDFVIIDCAPVLTSVEARIIARMADAFVMVVGANSTPRHSVARALSRLSDVTVAGMVLNRFDPCYSYRAEYLSAPARL